MKRERRHELEQNELADWMGVVIKTCKPYANLLLGGVLLLAIVIIGATLWARKSGTESSQAWDEFYRGLGNRSFLELEGVIEHYPSTDVAQWARVIVGDLYLADGCIELFRSRAGANQQLRKAIEHYEALAECSNPTLRGRATFGLARAREAQGELDKAIAEYKKLAEDEGPFQAVAQERAKSLASPPIRAFCDEFAKFDPKPAYTEPPVSPFDFDKMESPSPKEPSLPGMEPLKLESEPSAAEKPAESKPAETKPAEPALPTTGLPEPAAPPTENPAPAAPPAETPPAAASASSAAETPAPAGPAAAEPKKE